MKIGVQSYTIDHRFMNSTLGITVHTELSYEFEYYCCYISINGFCDMEPIENELTSYL